MVFATILGLMDLDCFLAIINAIRKRIFSMKAKMVLIRSKVFLNSADSELLWAYIKTKKLPAKKMIRPTTIQKLGVLYRNKDCGFFSCS